MSAASILVAEDAQNVHIRLIGRATFACSESLRDYGCQAVDRQVPNIRVDLSGCEHMDSTILGVLARIGLRACKYGLNVEVVNASDHQRQQLSGLGLTKLFVLSRTEENRSDWEALCRTTREDQNPKALTTERTVLDAHEALMDLDPENIPRFRDVVDYLKQDIKRLESES